MKVWDTYSYAFQWKCKLVEANQLHYYLYWGDNLSHMTFYDFCWCIKLQTKVQSKQVKNSHKVRLGVLCWHKLKPGNSLHITHELLEHTNEVRGEMSQKLVPCVVEMSIPWAACPKAWALFILIHFKSFSYDKSLFLKDHDSKVILKSSPFSEASPVIMQNWNARMNKMLTIYKNKLNKLLQASLIVNAIVHLFMISMSWNAHWIRKISTSINQFFFSRRQNGYYQGW